jgi:transposase
VEEKSYKNKKQLIKMYWENKLSAREIADNFNCNERTIRCWMEKFNIPRRSLSEALKISNNKPEIKARMSQLKKGKNCGKDSKLYGIPLTSEHIKKCVESYLKKHPKLCHNKDWLYDQYVLKGKSLEKIAEISCCGTETIRSWIIKFKIPIRSHSQSTKNYYNNNPEAILSGMRNPMYGKSGEKSPNYIDGKNVREKRYCFLFSRRFKERIRNNFGRECFICGSPEGSHKLAVHHIDYNKTSLCKGRSWAFIPLCSIGLSCHTKTNFNRGYWFNLLINFWAMDPSINFKINDQYWMNWGCNTIWKREFKKWSKKNAS